MQSDDVTLWHGDCLKLLADLGRVDAVISDPPWGIDADTDYRRFTNGIAPNRNHGGDIIGDALPFDPRPFLGFPYVALWGANCFANQLPLGRWLVWLKKRDSQIGTFLSDCELCWCKKRKTARRAPGVYLKRHVWHGFDRQSEKGKVLHPTQKPVAIMEWTLEMAGVPKDGIVLDPFMGSGATGVACVNTGRRFIGIEKDAEYFRIAEKRIAAAKAARAEQLIPA